MMIDEKVMVMGENGQKFRHDDKWKIMITEGSDIQKLKQLSNIQTWWLMKINGDRSMDRHPRTKANYSAKYSTNIWS